MAYGMTRLTVPVTQTGSTPRRWRLLRGPALPPARRFLSRRPDTGTVTGRCPGCGGLVRLAAEGSRVYRCGHCETPLIACVGELDVELAVQARLYRAISYVAVDPDDRTPDHG